jgi:excisionase family DNA binding protein
MERDYTTPILFPVQLEIFWGQLRQVISEELRSELKKVQPQIDEPLLTRREIAGFLKISLVTLNDWMKRRGLPFHRRRRGPRFLKSEVLKWLKDSEDSM